MMKTIKSLATFLLMTLMIALSFNGAMAYTQNATFTITNYPLDFVSALGNLYAPLDNQIITSSSSFAINYFDRTNHSDVDSVLWCSGASLAIDDIIYCGFSSNGGTPYGLKTFNASGASYLSTLVGWTNNPTLPLGYSVLMLDNKFFFGYDDKIIIYDYNGENNATWNKNISIGALDMDYDNDKIYVNNGSYVKVIDRTTLTVEDIWDTGATGIRSIQVYDDKIYTSARVFNTDGDTITNLPYGTKDYLTTDGDFYYVNGDGEADLNIYNMNNDRTHTETILLSSNTKLIDDIVYWLKPSNLATITTSNLTYDNITATITPTTIVEDDLVEGYCGYNSTTLSYVTFNATFYKNDILYSTADTIPLATNQDHNIINIPSIDTTVGDEIYLSCKANVSSTDITETKTVISANNTPPIISSYTVSDETPNINQTVIVAITEGNVEPLDIIRFGMKCEGTEANYSENTNGVFNCEYDTAGTYNMTIAITDNFHIGTWYDETNITITVSSQVFIGGILNLQLIDDQTDEYVENATITADGQNTTTDAFGRATITTSEETSYTVISSKDGYYDKYSLITADGTLTFIYIEPITAIGTTNLLITVKDEDSNNVEGALVSYTNTISYQYSYGFTDANGQILINDVDGGTAILQASHDDYDTNSKSINIGEGMTNDYSITITRITDSFRGTAHIERNCVDEGLWLCGDESIVQHSCTQDSDCELSDYCTQGLNTCHRFNFSACDEIGMPRTQGCIAKLTGEGILTSITNWVLTNLLWIIMLLLLFVSLGLIFVSWKGK